jgi:hypothetical protein
MLDPEFEVFRAMDCFLVMLAFQKCEGGCEMRFVFGIKGRDWKRSEGVEIVGR